MIKWNTQQTNNSTIKKFFMFKSNTKKQAIYLLKQIEIESKIMIS